MTRETHAFDPHAKFAGQFDVDNRKRDRDPFPVVEHLVDIAVRTIVEVAAAAVETEFGKENGLEHPEFGFVVGVVGKPRGNARRESLQVGTRRLDIHLRIVEPGDQQRSPKQIDFGIGNRDHFRQGSERLLFMHSRGHCLQRLRLTTQGPRPLLDCCNHLRPLLDKARDHV